MAEWIEVTLPASDPPADESVIAQWLKKPGESVALHEPLLEVSTDKVALEIPSPATGVLREILKQEGDSVSPGEVLGRLEAASSKGGEEANVAEPEAGRAEAEPAGKRGQPEPGLSPAVRRSLKEHGLDSSQISGSGRGGRITHQDVTRHLEGRARAAGTPAESAPAGETRLLPHSPMRRRIAAHMVESLLKTAPHVTAVFEADFTAVQRHRLQSKEDFQRRGVQLTYTAYLVAASAVALRQTPEVNSRWREAGLEVYRSCHIGVATALGREGLVVPVIRDAQDLSLFGIASRLQELTQLARRGKLSAEQLEGGTFTITNHGVSGSLIATPVIHQPQSAILGVGKIQKRVVVQEDAERGDSLRIAPMAYVTLTIDHRALDGFVANEFLTRLVAALETWS